MNQGGRFTADLTWAAAFFCMTKLYDGVPLAFWVAAAIFFVYRFFIED